MNWLDGYSQSVVLGQKLLSVCIHNTDSGIGLSFKLKDASLNLTLGRNSYDEEGEAVEQAAQ